jgi:hypothetical protein
VSHHSYNWTPRRIRRSSRPRADLKLAVQRTRDRERKIDARLPERCVSFRLSAMVSEPLSVLLQIGSLLDGTIYGTRFRVRQLMPKDFWNPRDPGWRIQVIVRRVPVLTSALKSWIDGVIVPALVTQYLAEVRP